MSLLLFPDLLVTMVLLLLLNRELIIWSRGSVLALLPAPLLQQQFLRQASRVLFSAPAVLAELLQLRIAQMKILCPPRVPQQAVDKTRCTWSRA